MSLRVTVAALGPTADNVFQAPERLRYFTGPAWQDQGPDLRWDEREKVELEIDESDTLATVIDRAAAELGIGRPNVGLTFAYQQNLVSGAINGVAFYKPADDEPGGQPGPFRTVFPTLSANGEISWQTLDRTKMGELVRASDAGLLPGDPLLAYLRPMVTQGGGLLDYGDPAMFLEAVKHFVEAMRTVGELYAGGLAVGAVLRRLRGAESVDEQELVSRNAGPEELNELLRHYHELTLPVLARALAADENAATAIAEMLGYDVNADGAIVYSREPDAEFVRALVGWLRSDVYAARAAGKEDLESLTPFAEGRLRALAEGRREGESDWRYAWREVNPFVPEDVDPEHPEDDETEDHPEYRLITIRDDEGVDPAEIEAQLAQAGADEYLLIASLHGVKLAGGGTGLILILAR